ncbi:MAG TPA: hypothetical protein PKE45_22825 [Caldilineaceae bacterium]|nr:hypothetical protein [Caldilineaceae bacterium]
MQPYELTTCSFIVKIWVEETQEEAGHVTWRGHITHVSSGARQYFEDLRKIIGFMTPFLESMGIDLENNPSSGE